MAVVARFYVQSITRNAGNPETGDVRLNAVSRGPENKEWAAFTPSGQLTMSLSNKAQPALAWFDAHLGKEVLITIDDAPEPPVES